MTNAVIESGGVTAADASQFTRNGTVGRDLTTSSPPTTHSINNFSSKAPLRVFLVRSASGLWVSPSQESCHDLTSSYIYMYTVYIALEASTTECLSMTSHNRNAHAAAHDPLGLRIAKIVGRLEDIVIIASTTHGQAEILAILTTAVYTQCTVQIMGPLSPQDPSISKQETSEVTSEALAGVRPLATTEPLAGITRRSASTFAFLQ